MNLPPCIKRIVASKDLTYLDEIMSYFHTFGTEGFEPVLWSIGYLTLDSYDQKKSSAIGMMKAAEPLVCPLKVQEPLKKFCGDCPLRQSIKWLDRAVKQVYLTPGVIPTSRVLVVEMHDGLIYHSGDFAFNPTNTSIFLSNVAQDFSVWLRRTYGFSPDAKDIANLLRERLWG